MGGWRTLVEAIDVHTAGLGGDSHVRFEPEGQLQIGPRRAVPLSLLAIEHPQVLIELRRQAARATCERLRDPAEFIVSGAANGSTGAARGGAYPAAGERPPRFSADLSLAPGRQAGPLASAWPGNPWPRSASGLYTHRCAARARPLHALECRSGPAWRLDPGAACRPIGRDVLPPSGSPAIATRGGGADRQGAGGRRRAPQLEPRAGRTFHARTGAERRRRPTIWPFHCGCAHPWWLLARR